MSLLRDYAATVTQPTLPFAVSGHEGTRYDEVIDPDGILRPHWRALAAVSLGDEDLRRIEAEIAVLLADDGVTYAPAGQPPETWRLDPVPLVIDAAGWARLDAGLTQRAELLNALLVDLYGERRVLRDGILPAAAIFGHSGYLRPLVHPHGDPQPLLFSATDLGRDAHGEWRVIADRVQAPSGLGFTAENRRVVTHVLPELFHASELHRLEPYFEAVRETLLRAAPEGVTHPRVVVLSPGSHSETAYDQAFVAGALGFPLVQGTDLVVRDGAVWMTPPGWPDAAPRERVDVILRRVDAEWCDPLELRGDSHLGVAGLLQAARRGTVRIVNGLGAGVLENPALAPYLGAACERLLGEQLRLDSIPTWWCADPAFAEVTARLRAGDPTLVVRTIDGSRTPVSAQDPRALLDQIAAAPHRYAAQELLPLSHAPSWHPAGGLRPRAVTLRTFTVRHQSTYRPLVGGMASTVGDESALAKDVWVLKADAADPDQGLVETAPSTAISSIPAFSPRALDDLFWSGRYAERAEDLLRIVLALRSEADPVSMSRPARSIRIMMEALRHLGGMRFTDADDEVRSLLLDATRPGSAAHSLARLRTALEGVRDQLSNDTWRVFAASDRAIASLRGAPHSHRIAETASRMLTAVLALQGTSANMIRDAGWHMIEAGRSLERALQLTSLLSQTIVEVQPREIERDVLEAVLTASESVVTHRRRYRGAVSPRGAVDLLLSDAENPRSLRFALARTHEHLAAQPASTGSSRPERLLEELDARVRDLDSDTLVRVTDGRRVELAAFLEAITEGMAELARAIEATHFSSGPPPQPLSALSLTELTGAVS